MQGLTTGVTEHADFDGDGAEELVVLVSWPDGSREALLWRGRPASDTDVATADLLVRLPPYLDASNAFVSTPHGALVVELETDGAGGPAVAVLRAE